MSEMIERVAKAIYAEFENRPHYAQAQMNGVMASELARAAIASMREPNDAMCEAAGWHQQSEVNQYQRAIDAALAKQGK